MGAWSARITRADILTSGVGVPDCATEEAGRVGGVRLELIRTPAGTRLGRVYQQVPLRVLPAFSLRPEGPALVYLLNPTAGLFEGDAQLIEITAEPGTRAVVTGQSATRIHPSLGRFASQHWRIHVRRDAVLVVLPGPAIPFRDCRYHQRVEVELEEGAGFVWGDIWLSGRYSRGDVSEQFQFAVVDQQFAARRSGSPVFRDRFHWRGPWTADEAAWHFGGAVACGSLFVTESRPAAKSPAEHLARFRTDAGDTCWRWCGESEQVTASVVAAADAAAVALCGEPPESSWFLDGAHLAPSHWFSVRARDSVAPCNRSAAEYRLIH